MMENKQELSYGVYVGFFLYVECLCGSLRVSDFCFRSTDPLFDGNLLIYRWKNEWTLSGQGPLKVHLGPLLCVCVESTLNFRRDPMS